MVISAPSKFFCMCAFSVGGKKTNDRKNALDNGVGNSLKHKEAKINAKNTLNRI